MYGVFPLIFARLLTVCSKEATDSWQGYIEDEFVLLASPCAEKLQKLYVRRGDRVEAASSRATRCRRCG